ALRGERQLVPGDGDRAQRRGLGHRGLDALLPVGPRQPQLVAGEGALVPGLDLLAVAHVGHGPPVLHRQRDGHLVARGATGVGGLDDGGRGRLGAGRGVGIRLGRSRCPHLRRRRGGRGAGHRGRGDDRVVDEHQPAAQRGDRRECEQWCGPGHGTPPVIVGARSIRARSASARMRGAIGSADPALDSGVNRSRRSAVSGVGARPLGFRPRPDCPGSPPTMPPARDRDEALVHAVYSEHGRALLAYATRLTGDRAAAEDIVQETLIRAWRHPEVLTNGKGSARGWLLTVVRNLVTDRYRAKAARPQEVAENPDAPPIVRDHADSVVASVTVMAALEELSEDHRGVLDQIYFKG